VSKVSINPINLQEFYIKEENEERVNIDSFIKKNNQKKIVVVLGLGFVGAAMSVVVSNKKEFAVIGVDLGDKRNYWKIGSINSGILPLHSADKKLEKSFRQSYEKNKLIATYSEYAFKKADYIIVDINLDVDKVNNQDKKIISYNAKLDNFKESIEKIFMNCKQETLVLVETTVPPGTCENIIKPIAKKAFSERGINLEPRIGHSYERVTPGPNYLDSIENFYRVYSGIDEVSSNATEIFLRKIIHTDKYPLTRLNNTNETETAKVLENSYRAMNIAFISEWTEFAEKANIDLFGVIDAIRLRPTHSNIMYPGLGVGGYCLTKDPLLASWASMNLFNGSELAQSVRAVEINDGMPLHTFEKIKEYFKNKLSDKKFLILGVSYIQDLSDTRFSPVEYLYDLLLEENSDVSIYDPYVKFWEERNLTTIQNIGMQYDAVIAAVKHSEFQEKSFLDKLNQIEGSVFFDAFSVYRNRYHLLGSFKKIVKIGVGY